MLQTVLVVAREEQRAAAKQSLPQGAHSDRRRRLQRHSGAGPRESRKRVREVISGVSWPERRQSPRRSQRSVQESSVSGSRTS